MTMNWWSQDSQGGSADEEVEQNSRGPSSPRREVYAPLQVV